MYKQIYQMENRTVRVLVVDDDPAQRKLERLILEEQQYDILEAIDGHDALAIIKQQDIDVVLLDRYMPGINGDEVCRHIREDLGNFLLPVIIVTGDESPTALAATLNGYANDFIKKPYSQEELVARVNSSVSMKRLTDQLENIESVLFSLARMVEAKDKNTGDHCLRLTNVCEIFGRNLGLTGAEIEALRRGAVLHDIGKLGIPDSILLKPGALTDQEKTIMQTHTVIGHELCRGLKTLKTTLPIIRNHHENYDGSGYPDKLTGSNIPLLARVFQVADIYDALSSTRAYKIALSVNEVITIFETEIEKGWRDPDLVGRFLRLLKDNPEDLLLADRRDHSVEKYPIDGLTHKVSAIQGGLYQA